MKYFFILGNNPTLSVAEISAVFPNAKNLELLNESVLVLESEEFNAKEMIKRMGGVIKIGIIEESAENNNKVQKIVNKIIDTKRSPGFLQSKTQDDDAHATSKFKFGISFYGPGKINPKAIGMEAKKHLREQGISCRWVTSKEKTLSSVVVEQNKLTSNGIEIVVIRGASRDTLIGQTLAVQPFKELSYRDYNRPARDDKSGMLPPKLAQIMINLATNPPLTPPERGIIILDPHCGSGTILTEAMLMGYKNIIGSDISKKAVQDTKVNIEWTEEEYNFNDLRLTIHELSSTELSKKIELSSIDIIVTEPFLGPQRGKIEFKKVIRELEELYSKSLKEFEKILKPDGIIVMLFPVFYNKYFINPNLGKFKIKNPIPEKLRNSIVIKLSNRETIIYGREGQKVWREIVILTKQQN